uniref:RRM domain-containing protein n=1 Tax=Ditylum brightwellii TaxID=49249 RepID=A0A7S4T585_9STRA
MGAKTPKSEKKMKKVKKAEEEIKKNNSDSDDNVKKEKRSDEKKAAKKLKKEAKKEKSPKRKRTADEQAEKEEESADQTLEEKENATLNEDSEKPEGCKTIFVGNLSFDIDEGTLGDTFKDCGKIISLRFVEDKKTGNFKGCVFIEFEETESTDKAMKLVGKEIMGRSLTVEYEGGKKKRIPSEKPEGCKTVFVGNLSFDIDENTLRDAFKVCGKIMSIRFVKDKKTGDFKGFGFIDFKNTESTDQALQLADTDIKGRSIIVEYVGDKKKDTKKPEGCKTAFVGNLSHDIDEDTLRDAFKDCGAIASVRLVKDRESGKSKGFGFIEFEDTESTDKALKMVGTEIMGRALRVDYSGVKGTGKGGSRRRSKKRKM